MMTNSAGVPADAQGQDQDEMLRSVLYIEDEPVNVLLMEALFLHLDGYKLHVAATGLEAWTLSAVLQPELLLVDLRLPDCHGEQLLNMLRRRPGWEKIPAIAVTAEHKFEIEGSGFCELWAKPLNLPKVVGRLRELLPPLQSAPALSATGKPSAILRRGSSYSAVSAPASPVPLSAAAA